jgi:16S rRNA (uracil1498-N3)-methyltransferase
MPANCFPSDSGTWDNAREPSLATAVLATCARTVATILVGPEGDFSPQETAAALAAGFIPVSLGNIVLRVETASLFCISALRYEFA